LPLAENYLYCRQETYKNAAVTERWRSLPLRTYIDYFDRGNADIYTVNGVSIVEGGPLDPLGRLLMHGTLSSRIDWYEYVIRIWEREEK